MAAKNTWRRLRTGKRFIADVDCPCIWMSAGIVTYRLCESRYDCDSCAFYRAIKGRGEAVRDQVSVKGFRLQAGLFYHPGHAWARIEERGSMRVGLDDFGQALLGRVQEVDLPPRGTRMGKTSIRIRGRGVDVALKIPADGTVTDVNEAVRADPLVLNTHPYGGGWILVVRPVRLSGSLKQLYYGAGAESWYERELDRLQGLMARAQGGAPGAGGVGVTLQDGGAPLLGLLDGMKKKTVRRIIQQFFRGGPP